MCARTPIRKANNKTAWNRRREKTLATETQVCYKLRYATYCREGAEARKERSKQHNSNCAVVTKRAR